jgi:hypothetical protein
MVVPAPQEAGLALYVGFKECPLAFCTHWIDQMVAGMPESVHYTRKTSSRNFLVHRFDAPFNFACIDPKGFFASILF